MSNQLRAALAQCLNSLKESEVSPEDHDFGPAFVAAKKRRKAALASARAALAQPEQPAAEPATCHKCQGQGRIYRGCGEWASCDTCNTTGKVYPAPQPEQPTAKPERMLAAEFPIVEEARRAAKAQLAFRDKMLEASGKRPKPEQPAAEPVGNEVRLNIIRQWPPGFEARLEHVFRDLRGFIPNYKLHDIARVLAEFGFTMKVYEGAAPQQLDCDGCGETCRRAKLCATCGRELEQPAAEPVARVDYSPARTYFSIEYLGGKEEPDWPADGTLLYAAPQPVERQPSPVERAPLSDVEIDRIGKRMLGIAYGNTDRDFARAVLREANITGDKA